MTNTSRPIVFFGTEDFSLTTLARLIEAGFPIAAVVTKPDQPKGRGHKLTPPPVKVLALEHDIPVWQPTKLAEIEDDLKALDHPVGVLVSYGKIIPQRIIDLFTPGIINVHPSLLPTYRGPSPMEAAILHGDNETGISIMQLSAAMDAGPVYTQETFPLTGKERAEDLYASFGTRGADSLVELLPAIINGTLQPTAQDETAATYCQLIKKSDGLIDWTEPAEIIERKIRAYHLWPGTRTTLGSVEVIITDARVTPSSAKTPGTIELIEDAGTLAVYTGDGRLCIDRLKPVGKKEMPVRAFLSGYTSQLGL